VTLSTSFFHPWTTLPAIMLTLLLIMLGFSQIRKRPVIALAVLFFFLNHVIESTVLPLELIFEHRNYLPSMFLFLPFLVGCKWLYDCCAADKQPLLKGALTGLAVLSIVCLGVGTYVRNMAWATEISLWRDAMEKAPQSARPLTNLAWQMAYGPGACESQYDEALKLYEKALFLEKSRSFFEPIIMNNMAGIYFRQGKHQKAIDLLESALIIAPDYTRGRFYLAKILITSEKWKRAEKHIDYLLAKDDAHEGYLNLKGLICLHQRKYADAVQYFRNALATAPFYQEALINLGFAYSLNGDYRNAEVFLRRAHRIRPRNMLPLLGLIENNLRAGDVLQAKAYTDDLISLFKMTAVKNQLLDISKNNLLPPLSTDLILSTLDSRELDDSREISQTQN
jgi:Tfp pilus assembly protein PilF